MSVKLKEEFLLFPAPWDGCLQTKVPTLNAKQQSAFVIRRGHMSGHPDSWWTTSYNLSFQLILTTTWITGLYHHIDVDSNSPWKRLLLPRGGHGPVAHPKDFILSVGCERPWRSQEDYRNPTNLNTSVCHRCTGVCAVPFKCISINCMNVAQNESRSWS